MEMRSVGGKKMLIQDVCDVLPSAWTSEEEWTAWAKVIIELLIWGRSVVRVGCKGREIKLESNGIVPQKKSFLRKCQKIRDKEIHWI